MYGRPPSAIARLRSVSRRTGRLSRPEAVVHNYGAPSTARAPTFPKKLVGLCVTRPNRPLNQPAGMIGRVPSSGVIVWVTGRS